MLEDPTDILSAQAQALAEREKERSRVQKNEEAYLRKKEELRLSRLEEARLKRNEDSRQGYQQRKDSDAHTKLDSVGTANEEAVSNDASPIPHTENNKMNEVKEAEGGNEVEVNAAEKMGEEEEKEKEREEEEEEEEDEEGVAEGAGEGVGEGVEQEEGEGEGNEDISEGKKKLADEEGLVQRNEERWLAKVQRDEQRRVDKENTTIARLRDEYHRLIMGLDSDKKPMEAEAGEEGESSTQQSPIQGSSAPDSSTQDPSTDQSPPKRLEDLPRHKRRVASYTREYTPKELRLRTLNAEIACILRNQKTREERHKQRAIEVANGQRDSRGRLLWYAEKLKRLALEARERGESSTQQSPDQEPSVQNYSTQKSPINAAPLFRMPDRGKPESKIAQYKKTLTPEQLIRYEERHRLEIEKQRKQRQDQKNIEIANGQRDARGKLLWWPQKLKKAAMEAEARERERAESSTRGPSNEESLAQESLIDDAPLFQMPEGKPESKVAQYKSTLTPEQLDRFNEKREVFNNKRRWERQQQKEIEIANGQRDARGRLLWWPEKLKRDALEAETRARNESPTQPSSNQDSPDQGSPISVSQDQLTRYREQREVFNGKRRMERQQQKEIEIANGQRDASGKLLWWSEKRKRDALEAEEAKKRESSAAGSSAEGSSTEQAKRSASEELAAEELEDKRLYRSHMQQRNRQIQKDIEIAKGQRSADGTLLWYPEKLARDAIKAEESRKLEESFTQGSSTQEASTQESAIQEPPNKESPDQQSVTRKRKGYLTNEELAAEFEERYLLRILGKQADRQNQEEKVTSGGLRSPNRALTRSQTSTASSSTLAYTIGVQDKLQTNDKMDEGGYKMVESSEVRKGTDVSAIATDEPLQASMNSSISQSDFDNSPNAWWRALQ